MGVNGWESRTERTSHPVRNLFHFFDCIVHGNDDSVATTARVRGHWSSFDFELCISILTSTRAFRALAHSYQVLCTVHRTVLFITGLRSDFQLHWNPIFSQISILKIMNRFVSRPNWFWIFTHFLFFILMCTEQQNDIETLNTSYFPA